MQTGKKICKRTEDGFRLASYSKSKYDALPDGDTTDLTNVVEMGIESLRQMQTRGGKQYKFSPDPNGLKQFISRSIEYFEELNRRNANAQMKRKILPDVEGWCCYMGISRMTLSHYYNQRGEDWREAIDSVKTLICSAKKQLTATFQTPPIYTIFDLTNNHGYRNTNEFRLIPETATESKPRESIESIIERRKDREPLSLPVKPDLE